MVRQKNTGSWEKPGISWDIEGCLQQPEHSQIDKLIHSRKLITWGTNYAILKYKYDYHAAQESTIAQHPATQPTNQLKALTMQWLMKILKKNQKVAQKRKKMTSSNYPGTTARTKMPPPDWTVLLLWSKKDFTTTRLCLIRRMERNYLWWI